MTFLIGIAIGAAMGLVAGLTGVGGGIIAVPAMIYFMEMDTKIAMATSLAVIIPVSIAGTVKHAMAGHVDYRTAVSIAVGGIVCAYLGAWLNHKLDPVWLKKGFAVLIILVGIKMILEKPKPSESPTVETTQAALPE